MVPRSITTPGVGVGAGAGVALPLALPPERTVNFAPIPATSTTTRMMTILPLPFFLTSPSWAAALSFAMVELLSWSLGCSGSGWIGEDHDLDPPVGGPALGRRVGGCRVEFAVAGGREPGRGDGVAALQDLQDRHGAVGREVPVGVAIDVERDVVGVALDQDRVREPGERGPDGADDPLPRGADVRRSRVEQDVVGGDRRDEPPIFDGERHSVADTLCLQALLDVVGHRCQVRLPGMDARGDTPAEDRGRGPAGGTGEGRPGDGADGRAGTRAADRARRRAGSRDAGRPDGCRARLGVADAGAGPDDARATLHDAGVGGRSVAERAQALQELLELLLVRVRDAVEGNEERHQQGHEVPVGDEPARVGAAATGHQAATGGAADFPARPVCPLRSSGLSRASSRSTRMRLAIPSRIPRTPSMAMRRTATSASCTRFSFVPIGMKKRLAAMTPQSVPSSPSAIPLPSLVGSDRSRRTPMSPTMVPISPKVGATPPRVRKNCAMSWWRWVSDSISTSRTSRTCSPSTPSMTSCKPVLRKGSSSLPISLSRASMPSLRATSAKWANVVTSSSGSGTLPFSATPSTFGMRFHSLVL